jgi:DNA-directed RNA polymerase subunit RPC12/RpoP
MKRVCAWCGQELDQPERREDIPVTHGVCPTCRRRFFAKELAKEADTCPTQDNVGNDSGKTGGQAPTE